MKKLMIILLMMIPVISTAAWVTNAEDSIFDEKAATMLGQLSQGSAVMLECKGDDLYIYYIEEDRNTDTESFKGNVTLLLKIDDNKPIEFNAKISRRNNEFVQVTSNESAGILNVLDELRKAKKRFMVGLTIKGTDYRMSWSGDVYNSTAATKKFIQSCAINYQF
ncbi:hypothetical protein [Morganella morganii]|uniref:hypothetical protein n=1 Tax=Morganella morganii TaxID=582 RepID=UPI0032DBED82